MTEEEKEEVTGVEEALEKETDKEKDELEDYRDGVSSDEEIKAAIERGWDPNHDDPDKPYRTAHDYLLLEPFYQEIHKLKKEHRKTKDAFSKFQEYAEKQKEREYNRAVQDLKKEKKEALENEDHDRVVEIDEEMKKAEKDYESSTPKEDTNEAFEEFKQRNPWYESDVEMAGVADGIGISIARQNPETPIEDIYEKVENRMKELFPDRFGTKKKETPSVEGGGNSASKRAGSKKKKSVKDLGLSREEEAVVYNMLEMTGLSESDYIKDLELEKR